MVSAYAATDPGPVRSVNEDAFLLDVDQRLYAVADGMGGHNAGEVASKLALEALAGFVRRSATDTDLSWPYGVMPELSFLANRLRTALHLANRRVFRAAESHDDYTGMGDGILKGRELLLGVDSDPDDEGFSRYGARPTMIVMTDGQANRCPAGWALPGSFKWKDWTDYDGDGVANYTTTDKNKQYAFWEATKAIDRGATLHTLAVGADGDRAQRPILARLGDRPSFLGDRRRPTRRPAAPGGGRGCHSRWRDTRRQLRRTRRPHGGHPGQPRTP